MAERKIRGVLFDMDGLLVDSERVGAQVMIDAARRQNVPVSLDVVKSTLGTTLEKCREIYARHYPALQYEPLRQDFCEEMHRLARAGGIPLKPGAKALLDARRCGAAVLATAHAAGFKDALRRESLAAVLREGVFDRMVLLGPPPGRVRAIYDCVSGEEIEC